MKGVILDSQTLKPSELDFSDLEKLLPEWTFYEQSGPDDVKNRLRGVTVAITNKVVIDADTLAASPDLKLICISATGTNNVDLEAARRQGVVVCNVSGYATATVAQHTLALMLGLATAWHRYDADARAGRWSESDMFCRMDYPVVELAGKTLGLIGHGDLGRRVAALAEAAVAGDQVSFNAGQQKELWSSGCSTSATSRTTSPSSSRSWATSPPSRAPRRARGSGSSRERIASRDCCMWERRSCEIT